MVPGLIGLPDRALAACGTRYGPTRLAGGGKNDHVVDPVRV
jgi:hypothetical protein